MFKSLFVLSSDVILCIVFVSFTCLALTNDGFAENAVYHATCMTNYLLKRIKDDSEDYLTSEHDNLFQSFISTIKDDLLTHKKIFTVYIRRSTGPSKKKTTD
jgi:hypothetical protein